MYHSKYTLAHIKRNVKIITHKTQHKVINNAEEVT